MTEPVTSTRSCLGAIDPFVKAFEAAWTAAGPVAVDAYLPPPNDPRYPRAVLEMVRIDLEFGWEVGRPKSLDHYCTTFPTVFREPGALQAIAFEEYRQRRKRGEDPCPTDYARLFGVDTSDWPPQRTSSDTPSGTVVVDLAVGLAAASQIYRECRATAGDIESAAAPPGATEALDLLRAVRRSNPTAADNLADAALEMPEAGDEFHGFHLDAELGRGAFGRVFLARQGELAGRKVALKVSADVADESQTLAQLQHTNIVPVYSIHHTGPFRVVCMPYLGATTLGDVIRSVRSSATLPASGKHLVSTLNDRKASTLKPTSSSSFPSGQPRSGSAHDSVSRDVPSSAGAIVNVPDHQVANVGIPRPLLDQIEGFSYIKAVFWLGARLADGLAHAHERGIVHRDLKPANVLLTDEGQPMLLDFNLADDALRERAVAARMGGTLPYMSPEQIAAFRGGRTSSVDARTDVYSLGLILFELLTGRAAFPYHSGSLKEKLPAMLKDRRQPPPRLIPLNPAVTPAAEAIIRKCLEPDPDRRYPSARALQDDITRHLDDRPLRHTPEPSVRERMQKWVRRHPKLTSSSTVAVAAAVLLATSAAVAAAYWQRHLEGVEADRREQARLVATTGLTQLATDRNIQRAMLNPLLNSTSRRDLRRVADLSRQSLTPYGVPADPNWLNGPLVEPLPPAEREQLGNNVAGMLLVWADAERHWAEGELGQSRADGLGLADRLTALATAQLGTDNLAVLAGTLKHGDRQALIVKAEQMKPRTAEDHFVLGRALMREHEVKKAIPHLVEATRQDPKHFWAWNDLGGCHYELGQIQEALACYGACIGMAPDAATAYFAHYQRATAYRVQRSYSAAYADVEHAIELLPSLPNELRSAQRPNAYLLLARILTERAKTTSSRTDYAAAEKALTDALAFDDGSAMQLYLQRAEVRRLSGDKVGARQDWEEMLRLEPADEAAWTNRGLAFLATGDTAAAVRDFDRALAINPAFHRALQNKAHVLSERMNKSDESLKVLSKIVDLYPDYTPARIGRGVLYARQGKRPEAHADAIASLARSHDSMTLYQAANIYALTSRQTPADADRVLPLLAAALWSDEAILEVNDDADMATVRDQPWFKQVIATVRAFKAESGH
jgi:serine/threonine protein kinase/tetratricopeptide (TPR) repeat protein